jgi:hypothetical protein
METHRADSPAVREEDASLLPQFVKSRRRRGRAIGRRMVPNVDGTPGPGVSGTIGGEAAGGLGGVRGGEEGGEWGGEERGEES